MSLSTEDRRFLDRAIEQARLGWKEGGIPIGAVLVHQGEVLAAGRNRRVQIRQHIHIPCCKQKHWGIRYIIQLPGIQLMSRINI